MVKIGPFHLSWIVEIVLIATAIYQIWKLLEGTRGARVLTGLATVLVTVTLAAHLFHLRVIMEIIRLFSPSFFLAVIVLFQPELRQILAELGTRPRVGAARPREELIEEMVTAVESLQRERFGALMAIEREDYYLPGRETGTLLHAKLSADLLVTIFYPRTPLHDGGVIIRGDEIVAAAAIFPLTQREQLERRLGLRHRAAIGLSEETDAVVVVLSEETGIISIACKGVLERPYDPDGLRTRLTELLL
ncbi:diadenylate cyclase CdaA [Candidatus Methylacidithermus pantelleriae]|uniref:Diadenylate cyclase n=1 Tax=Candidatus Methylacidithermus pantelleriae TaxID=2744239 RepID=A0A8J2BTA5_9BACT|nr:diadenylate cyclase CdaA [Candidatus Methylacidithermus pantelleriae]CAF0698758.1 Diadenylate cyclase [Candidatus Methylacidithermus pantelleriae]